MKHDAGERAAVAFLIYRDMGPTRSLASLQQRLHEAGIAISLATLKRWSRRFAWGVQLAELETAATARRHEQALGEAIAMLERHASLGRALQAAGGGALQQLMASPARIADLPPADIARLLDLGLRTEAKAAGAGSDRRELALTLANTMTTAVAELFLEVNSDEDAERRTRTFALRLDALIDRYLREQE